MLFRRQVTAFRRDVVALPSTARDVALAEFFGAAAPPSGALVWNASSLPVWAALSNGDRSLSGDYSGELGFAVTTASRSSGKWYAEIVVDEANSDGTAIVGIVSQAADSSYPGDTPEGVGWVDDGTLYGEFASGTAEPWSTGSTLCIAVDLDANQVWFRRNGNDWNDDAAADPATGANGIAFAFTPGLVRIAATIPNGGLTLSDAPAFDIPAGFEWFSASATGEALYHGVISQAAIWLGARTPANVNLGTRPTF